MLTTGHLPFPPSCCGWQGACPAWEVAAAGRVGAGAGPGRGPPPAALLGAAVLSRSWPPSLGWLELVRVVGACRAVGGCLRSGAALVDVLFDVVPLPSRSSLQTVTGCLLGGYPAGRDWWGGERDVGGVLPRINIGADVWGESNIMTGVYERWCSSTLNIRWGLCDSLCLVLVCRGRYGLGGVVFLFILGSNLGGVGPERGLRGERKKGVV